MLESGTVGAPHPGRSGPPIYQNRNDLLNYAKHGSDFSAGRGDLPTGRCRVGPQSGSVVAQALLRVDDACPRFEAAV